MTNVRVISGDLRTVGSVIEIPFTESNLGTGPIFEVDPITRKCRENLQRFEITAFSEGGMSLRPINGATCQQSEQ